MSNESIPFDFVTINEKVNIGNEPSFLSYLKDIINQTPSAANIVSYANIVREQSIVRQLINVSNTLIEKSYDGSIDSKTLLDEAEEKIFNITNESLKSKSGFKSINDVYDLMVTVQEDLEYIKKWGIECNGGSVECD